MTVQRAGIAVGVLALGVCWLLVLLRGSAFTLSQADQVLTAIPAALSLTILTGRAGLVSLAQGGLLALGSFCAGIIGGSWGLPFLAVLGISIIMGALAGLLASFPAARLRGFYLALATLALFYVIIYVLQEIQFSGANRIVGYEVPTASIGVALSDPADWYVALTVVTLLCIALTTRLFAGGAGRAWQAINHNEIAASISGVELRKYKALAFSISSGLAALSGALSAYQVGRVTIDQFDLSMAITYYAMIVIGGISSVAGAIIGAVIVTLLPYWTNSAVTALPGSSSVVQTLQNNSGYASGLVIAVLTVVVLLVMPGGVTDLLARAATAWPVRALRAATIRRSPDQEGATIRDDAPALLTARAATPGAEQEGGDAGCSNSGGR